MDGPVVRVKQGDLRGALLESVDGGSYISFKGIPFAAPPIGDLRFKDPRPPSSWSGVRDASEHAGDICPQFWEISCSEKGRLTGNEDCLYLNVYTTSISEVRPVMVWIHGGSFTTGSGNASFYGPDYLVKKDVVLVFINYRVGVLGFLNLDHEDAPGNQGLKDQIAALRWVKENIAAFGGDPDNVTIFGESAGSASVHYLALSPSAKGLFHKAIAQSASLTNPWSCRQSHTQRAYRLASLLGKESSDPCEVVEFLRRVPIDKLLEAQGKLLTLREVVCHAVPFGPNVDAKSKEPILPRPFEEMVAEGIDVPLLLGYNSHEGILFIPGTSEESLSLYNKHLEDNVILNMTLKDRSKAPDVVREIKKLYFGGQDIGKESVKETVDFIGDFFFVNGIHEVVEIQRNKATPTYYYRFSFIGEETTITKVYMKHLPVNGTSHADDLTYLFYQPRCKDMNKPPPTKGTADRVVMERFLRMWTDFAKTGNPTPRVDDLITTKWKPITKSTLNYMEINENLQLGANPDSEMRAAWERIYTLTR